VAQNVHDRNYSAKNAGGKATDAGFIGGGAAAAR